MLAISTEDTVDSHKNIETVEISKKYRLLNNLLQQQQPLLQLKIIYKPTISNWNIQNK